MSTKTEPVRLVTNQSDGTQIIEVTVRVAAEPVWFGFNRPLRELAEAVVDAIDEHVGLYVTEESRAEVTA